MTTGDVEQKRIFDITSEYRALHGCPHGNHFARVDLAIG